MAVYCATQFVASTVVCSSVGADIYCLYGVGCGLCVGLSVGLCVGLERTECIMLDIKLPKP
jgi:hypothetical protein